MAAAEKLTDGLMLMGLMEDKKTMDHEVKQYLAVMTLDPSNAVTRKGTCTTGKTTNDDDKRVARRIMSYV